MSAAPASTWTEPPWSGWIETTGDALLILEAARQGLIPRVTRRLVDSERRMITSGSVFVFDEEESGIKRWTDGFFWSPSRILGNFLLYRETDKRGAGHRSTRAEQELMQQEAVVSSTATRGLQIEHQSLSRPRNDNAGPSVDRQRERALIGSLTNSYKFKDDGLMKKTFSVTINGVAQHLISYYKIADVESGRLRSPSSLPELAALDISPEYLDKTHFRNPPKVEIGTDGIPRYRGESDDIEGNNSISVTYQTGLNVGATEVANNMLSGPVLATEQRHLNTDHLSGTPGNIGAKRGPATRLDSYGSPPQHKRSRKNTRTSEPPTGSSSSTSTPTSDHQPHGVHQSPQPHHLTAPQHQQPQSGGPVTYDAAAMQQQFQQQHQSLQHHLQAHQRSQHAQQQPQPTQYQQQPQPAQQNRQPATPTTASYPPPQYLPFYSVPPHGIYGPPPGAAVQPPQTYGPYVNPYGPAPPAHWPGSNIPSSVMATSPMSTSSDSPSPSPMHLTHAHAHTQQRRSSIGSQGQNPTSGLQNVTTAGADTTANPSANTNANINTTTTTRNEPPGPRSDPSQKPPGPLPRQEPPVQQHHHPPAATTTISGGAQGTTTNAASAASPASTTAGAIMSTPTPGPSPVYSYYPPPIPPPGHPHAHAHVQSPGSVAPVMGSLAGPPTQPGAPPPGQPPASMPMSMGMQHIPIMQGVGMGPPPMGMPPVPFGPAVGPYQWHPAPPHPGIYASYIQPPPGAGMSPGVYGPYPPTYGVGVAGATVAGPTAGPSGGAAAPQGQVQTQSVGAKQSAGAGQSGGAAAGGQGGSVRSGTNGGTAES